MNRNIAEIFFILVIFQLLFIAIFLFTHQKGRKLSNNLLAGFFLAVGLSFLDNFLALNKVYEISPALVGWGSCLPLTFGPALYLYTQSVLYKGFRMKRGRWVHFLPFVALFLFTEISFLSQTREMQLTILEQIMVRNIPAAVYWVSGGISLHYFIYTALSFRLIGRYKTMARQQFSSEERVNISWLSSTLVFFTLCMLLALFNSFLAFTPLRAYYYLMLTVLVFLFFVFISRVLLKALQKPELFALMQEQGPPVKYAGSGLTQQEKQQLLERLRVYMNEQRPYLAPELSLEQLAAGLSVKSKVLSQLINEQLGQNFFEFINFYRIELAKQMLTHPKDKKITVLEVLYEVGFNSKSSFNTLFKKHTGLTPSEFKKKHLEP